MALRQLKTDDLRVGQSDDVLQTSGVGSCVVICLWDSVRRIGGMAHMLLPKNDRDDGNYGYSPGLSPDTAIQYLVSKMELLGAVRSALTARLTGGGYMFGENLRSIPEGILAATLRVLITENLPLVAQDMGGTSGRQVAFNIFTGEIEVRFVDSGRTRYL